MLLRIVDKSFWIWMVLLSSFAACYAQEKQYTDQSEKKSPVQARTLEDRVNSFWEARKSGDLLTLYELEAVSVNGQVTLRQYVNKSGDLIYKDYKIVAIETESANLAHALIEVQVLVPGLGKSLQSQFEDTWVNLEGEWYHLGRAHMSAVQ
jgi:hypothetical protein